MIKMSELQKLQEVCAALRQQLDEKTSTLESVTRERDLATGMVGRALSAAQAAELQVGEWVSAIADLLNSDGAGADYDATKALRSRNRLREMIASRSRGVTERQNGLCRDGKPHNYEPNPDTETVCCRCMKERVIQKRVDEPDTCVQQEVGRCILYCSAYMKNSHDHSESCEFWKRQRS